MSFLPGEKPEEIIKSETTEIKFDLSSLVNRYLDLEKKFQEIPKLKTVPDQTTLDFYNDFILHERKARISSLKFTASELFIDLKQIKETGLLPDKYMEIYKRLEKFVL